MCHNLEIYFAYSLISQPVNFWERRKGIWKWEIVTYLGINMHENAKQRCKTSIYAHLHDFYSNMNQESSNIIILTRMGQRIK